MVSWAFNMPDKNLRGTWQTNGYGLVFDIGRTVIDVYQVTEISCYRDMRIPAHLGLVKTLEGAQFAMNDGQLQLAVAGALNPIYADRIDSLPKNCATPLPDTPQNNFDVLWNAMNEHYSFFELHGVDWAARQSLRPDPETNLDDDALFALLSETLTGLDDGHTYLYYEDEDGSENIFSPSTEPDWHDDRQMVRDTTLAQFPDGLKEIENADLKYGWAAPGIGYIYFSHMDPEAGLFETSTQIAHQAISEIIAEFGDATGLILDVRYNPGGSDDVSLAYASHFAQAATVAFSKTTRTSTGYSDPYQATLEPNLPSLSQPIILLTSPFTGSAAEIFTMTMRELPQVTTLGEATAGGLSDVINYILPNGWELGFSHQRYLTVSDEQYEAVGIPPDVLFQVDVEAARSGKDTTLRAAIRLLQGG